MSMRDPQLANLPSKVAQLTADVNDAVEAIETALLDGAPLKIDDANQRVGIGTTSPSTKLDVVGDVSAKSSVFLSPDVTTLGEVTSVSSSTNTQTFVHGTDFNYAVNTYQIVLEIYGLTPATWAVVSTITNGDTVTLGSWASTDGNPTSFTVDYLDSGSSQSEAFIYISSYASNFGFYASTSSGSSISYSVIDTAVATDNSSLAFSQPYFEIGNLTPFATSDVTVSSGTITISGGDYTSSISTGDAVVEKSYSTGPEVVKYELATGQWSNVVFDPTTALSGKLQIATSTSINSTADYVWGVMVFEIPSDWSEWIVQANYSFYASSAASVVGYPSILWMPDASQVTATSKLTVNESNPHVESGIPAYIYNSAQFSGNKLYIAYTTTGGNNAVNCTMSTIRHSSKDTPTPTTFCIFGYYDPRFTGTMSNTAADVLVRRLK